MHYFVIPALQWCSLTLYTGQVLSPQWCVMGVIVLGVGGTSQGWIDGIQFVLRQVRMLHRNVEVHTEYERKCFGLLC